MKENRVLIIGASGGVGWLLFEELKQRGIEVVGTYNLKEKNGLIQLDITNRDQVNRVVDKHKPTHVLHFGVMAQVGICNDNPAQTMRVNVGGTMNVVEAANSVDAVVGYGATINELKGYTDGRVCNEDTPRYPKQNEIYGTSKEIATRLVLGANLENRVVVSDLILARGYGMAKLFEDMKCANIRIDETRFPVYGKDYINAWINLMNMPAIPGQMRHIVSDEFEGGMKLSDVAIRVVEKFGIAPKTEIIKLNDGQELVKWTGNSDNPFPINIQHNADSLATANIRFISRYKLGHLR